MIARAIQEIKPKSDQKANCYREIERYMLDLRSTNDELHSTTPTLEPLQFRDMGKRVVASLKNAKTEIESFKTKMESFKTKSRSFFFDDSKFMELLSREIAIFSGIARMPITRGGQKTAFKYAAVVFAYHLILKFGQGPPTLTIDGAFFNLAAILYEWRTHSEGANLDWICRKVFYLARRKTAHERQ